MSMLLMMQASDAIAALEPMPQRAPMQRSRRVTHKDQCTATGGRSSV